MMIYFRFVMLVFLSFIASCGKTDFKSGTAKTGDKTGITSYNDSRSTQAPREGCQAFFTGLIVADISIVNNISKVFTLDENSEWVGEGKYADNSIAFPNSIASTFDGIAIDKGTKVTIYEKPNFEGRILFEEEGPYIVNNVRFYGSNLVCYSGEANCNKNETYNQIAMRDWSPNLQKKFPQSTRHFSTSDMHTWSSGSVSVDCK
mgnify:CR=1 FL=1